MASGSSRGRGSRGPPPARALPPAAGPSTRTDPLSVAVSSRGGPTRGRGCGVVRGGRGAKRGRGGDIRSPGHGAAAQVQQGPAPIVLRGAFSSIWGLDFQGQNLTKGRALISHLMNPEEEQIPGEETVTIRCRVIRETNINDCPWCVTLLVRVSDRKVLQATCSCYVGTLAKCKHVAAVYLFVNEERSEGKTDAQQQWKTPLRRSSLSFPRERQLSRYVFWCSGLT